MYGAEQLSEQPLYATEDFSGVTIEVLQLLSCCLGGLAQVGCSGRIRLGDNLAGAGLRVHKQLLGSLLGGPRHRVLVDQPCALQLRAFHGTSGALVGRVNDLLPSFENLAGLLQVGRNGEPKLVDEVEQAPPIDDEVPANGQATRFEHKLFQLVDELQKLQLRPFRAHGYTWPSFRRSAARTCGGTKSATSYPRRDTSRIRLALMYRNS